jgi:GPI-anchor transamidase subunit GAA1
MLLGMEAIKTYRTNPFFELGTTRIPTWTTPIIVAIFVFVLIPQTSLLGHLCGLVVGYLCEYSHPSDPLKLT